MAELLCAFSVMAEAPPPLEVPPAPAGDAVLDSALEGPKSRYFMTAAFHLYPEGVLSAEEMKYENMPEQYRQLYRDWNPPGFNRLTGHNGNRHLKSLFWKAEVCPTTKKPHIQLGGETVAKRPTPIELLHFLQFGDRNACKFIHPNNPYEAMLYNLKEDTCMPGARPWRFGDLPPIGEFPRQGGKRDGAGKPSSAYATPDDVKEIQRLVTLPFAALLASPIVKKFKVPELFNMARRSQTTIFKGVDARKYVTATWCKKGNIGKSTRPWIWAEINRKKMHKMVSSSGFYGRWNMGFDHQPCLQFNEFSGNWIGGFHDFLDFLDAQFTRMIEVKTADVNTDYEFVFINSNVEPWNANPFLPQWKWIFPEEGGKVRVLTADEWALFTRRCESARKYRGGILEWDENIPKERSMEQPFLADVYLIRECELTGEPMSPQLVIPAMFDRQRLDGVPFRRVIPILPDPEVPDLPIPDIFTTLRRLEQEEEDDQQNINLNLTAQFNEDDAQDDRFLTDEQLEAMDRAADARDLRASALVDLYANDASD